MTQKESIRLLRVIACGSVTAILDFCYSVLNSLLVLTVLVLIIIGTTLYDLHMTPLSGNRGMWYTDCLWFYLAARTFTGYVFT